MTAVCLTTMGELWSGSGININAVDVSADGWVYLAGIDQGRGLIVMGYKDGQLAWSKTFHETGYGAFSAIKFSNGSVYASGGISVNFNGSDLTLPGQETVLAPVGKPVASEALKNKYPNFFVDPTYPIYVKLNAQDGTLEQAHVLQSLEVKGREVLSSIQVDSDGNVYVAGGGWNPGPDPKNSFDGADFHWYAEKFSNAGEFIWKTDGEHVVLNPVNQEPYITKYQNLIININPDDGSSKQEINTGLNYVEKSVSNYGRGWIYDAEGNIYVLAGQTFWDNVKSDWGYQHGVVVKINGISQEVEWTKTFGVGSKFCLPNSMTFTPEGNLIISGISEGDVEGVKGLGGKDGFIIEMSPADGNINSVEIVGSEKNESISQIKYQDVLDANGSVVDHNIIIGGAFASQKYSLEGKSESDIYLISKAGFTLIGNELDNLIQGGDGSDSISGGVGSDELNGGAGNDNLNGGTESDVLYGGDGNDTVDAGAGDDLIVGGDGAGNDSYKGGAGEDTVKYTSALAGIRVDLTKGTATSIEKNDASHIGNDTLKEIEDVIAGYHNDVITGSAVANKLYGEAGDDVLKGGAGNDYIDGGDGVDTADYSDKTKSVVVTLNGATESSVVIDSGNGVETDTIVNIENIIGGSAADTLTGDDADNVLSGGAGNDTLIGGGGNDSLVGGAGDDTYKLTKTTTLTDTVLIDESAGSGIDTIDIYEDLDAAGAPSEDDVTELNTLNQDGSWTHAFIVNGTQTGAFTIKGQVEFIRDHGVRAQEDFDNLIQLWYGSKSIKPSASVDATLGIGTAAADKMVGTTKSDRVYGFAGADTLDGKGENDYLFGGEGNDTYIWSDKYTGNTTISDESGTADQINLTTTGSVSFETDGSGHVWINNWSSSSLLGTLAFDAGTIEKFNLILNGKSTIYNSAYFGVYEESTIDLSLSNDKLMILARSDYDFELGSGDDFVIGDGVEEVNVASGAGNDLIKLSSKADDGLAGNVVIDGGLGADLMIGEAHNATYTFVVDNAKDVVIALGEGNYSIQSSVTYALNDSSKTLAQGMTASSTKYVSNLLLAGATNINGTGNSIDNLIEGNGGNNTLSGLAGNDEILGGAGNDTLIGGAGNDTLTGGSGVDTFRFDTALNANTNLDMITDFGDGADKISLSKSIFASVKAGVKADNLVTGDESSVLQANDFLRFNAGDQTLYYDADGSGTKFQAVAVVELTGVSSLSASDFIIV